METRRIGMSENTELTYEEQREIRNIKTKKKVEQLISDLFDELNHMGNEEKIGQMVVDAIKRQHPTLQQNFFGHCLINIIKDFSDRYNKGWYDLRNEESCKTASKINPIIKDAYFPFI